MKHCYVIHYVIIVFLLFPWSHVNGDDILNQLKDGSTDFQRELAKLVNLNLGYQTLQVNF